MIWRYADLRKIIENSLSNVLTQYTYSCLRWIGENFFSLIRHCSWKSIRERSMELKVLTETRTAWKVSKYGVFFGPFFRIYLFSYSFIYFFNYLFVCLYIYLFIHSFIHLFIHLFIYLFIYLVIYFWTWLKNGAFTWNKWQKYPLEVLAVKKLFLNISQLNLPAFRPDLNKVVTCS